MSYLPRGSSRRPVPLSPIGTRPSLGRYLADLWGRRHFIWTDARLRALSGNEGTVLGNAWLVLSPLLNAAVYAVLFGFVLQTSRGIENFLHFLVVGVFMFQFSARCVNGGATCIRSGQGLIRAFAFPRASLAVSVVTREAIAMAPVLGTLLVMLVLLPTTGQGSERVWPTLAWLLLPLLLVLQTLYNLGLALVIAPLVTRLPDLRNLVPFLTRVWFYGSGVFFSVERFVDTPAVQAFMTANPMYLVLDAYRDVLVYDTVPSAGTWLTLAAWSVGLVVVGTLAFWSQEERYAAVD